MSYPLQECLSTLNPARKNSFPQAKDFQDDSQQQKDGRYIQKQQNFPADGNPALFHGQNEFLLDIKTSRFSNLLPKQTLNQMILHKYFDIDCPNLRQDKSLRIQELFENFRV